MAFVDGEPLDAAKLGSLESRLTFLEAKTATFASPTSSSGVKDVANATVVVPKIIAVNHTEKFTFTEGNANEQKISFPESFSKIPTVVASIRHAASTSWGASIVITDIQASYFKFSVYVPVTAKNKTHSGYISYIAIAY